MRCLSCSECVDRRRSVLHIGIAVILDASINDKTKNADVLAKAEAAGWKGNELGSKKDGKFVGSVDNDIMVLANPEIAGLPNWVIALIAAGAIAAALSTAAACCW